MRVLFFASVRERLGCTEIDFTDGSAEMTTKTLRDALILRGGETWREVLSQPNLICAVNQAVVYAEVPLGCNDEVAFFPPVTGG
ncbi:MAG: MoaD/ThiS family protein [Chromatocurvus sp.]